jgi:hypothetical protein
MSELLPDVPVVVVVLHLLALAALLGHTAVISLRRLVLIRQSRQNTPNTLWFRLLQVSLGLTK